MANINLSTNQLSGSRKKPPITDIGTAVGLILLFIIVGVSIFLFVREESLSGKVSAAETAYSKKRAELTEGRNRDVIDLQTRIFKLRDVVSQRNSAVDSIQNIEKYLVAGVIVKDLSHNKEEKTIKLDCTAENHDVIAKQIASFKSFEFFSNVTLESTKVSPTGGIDFSVSIINK